MSTMFKIFIGNVNFKTTEDMLREIFAPHIVIEDLVIARDPATGRSMGYGFVMTRDRDKGREAIRRIGKFLIDGRRIYLKESKDKKKKTPSRPAGHSPTSNRPFRPRAPRPPGQGFSSGSRPPFPQRRSGPPPQAGSGFSRPMPPRTNPPQADRFVKPQPQPEVRPFPPTTGGGYVGLNQERPATAPKPPAQPQNPPQPPAQNGNSHA